jgi:hypothetical protein
LQKFGVQEASVEEEDDDTAAEAPIVPTHKPASAGEISGKILVVIDEAHRGIPEEGVHIKAVEARHGSDHCQILFTATPKGKILETHGKRFAGGRLVAHHVHTQRQAVAAKYCLNPLEFYSNLVSNRKVNGCTVAAMEDPACCCGTAHLQDWRS